MAHRTVTRAAGRSTPLSLLSALVPLRLWRRAWVYVVAAAVSLPSAAKVVSAQQLLDPEVWQNDVAESLAKGLAYNSKSGVLYQVGYRYNDIDTGAALPNSAVFMRGYNISSKNETFVYSAGTGMGDQWQDVAVDEDNGVIFAAGKIYNPDIDLRGSLYVHAFNETGDTLWSFQEHGRNPSLGEFANDQQSTFYAVEYDNATGLVLLAAGNEGCLGEGCTMPFDITVMVCLAVAVNATTGDLVWQRPITSSSLEGGIGAGMALGGEGVVFISGETTINAQNGEFIIAALEVETGEVIWEWRTGTVHSDGLNALAYDDDSGVLFACGYTAGNFSEPLDADPEPATKPEDAVVLALNTSTQELLWLNTFSSGPDVDRDEEALAITFDRNGVLHVSGATRGKGFNSAGGDVDDPLIADRASLYTYFAMSLNATDGETLVSFQSLDSVSSSLDASVMVPDTAQGDLYLGGWSGTRRNAAAITYVRSQPTLAPTPAPTTPGPTTPSPSTPAPSTPALTFPPTPAAIPTPSPTTLPPTVVPSPAPTPGPTEGPSPAPTPGPSLAPTPAPTPAPSPAPVMPDTPSPTKAPTEAPAPAPSPAPVAPDTPSPTNAPTEAPAPAPSPAPVAPDTPSPTKAPTEAPAPAPSPAPVTPDTPSPTKAPTEAPAPAPSPAPVTPNTPSPTNAPTEAPAPVPSPAPVTPDTPSPTPGPTEGPPPTSAPVATFPPTPAETAPILEITPQPVPPPTPTTDSPVPAPTASPVPAPTPSPVPPPTPSPVPPPTPSPTRAANVAGVEPDDAGGDSSGMTIGQQILILFGGLAAGGIVASLVVLCTQLGRKRRGALDDEDDVGDDPTSVDGTETDV